MGPVDDRTDDPAAAPSSAPTSLPAPPSSPGPPGPPPTNPYLLPVDRPGGLRPAGPATVAAGGTPVPVGRPLEGRPGVRITEVAVLLCLSGLGIGIATGATAGTMIVPVLGTAFGAGFGLLIAGPFALVGAAAVATLVVVRHPLPADPAALDRELRWAFGLLQVVVNLAAVAPVLDDLELRRPNAYLAAMVVVCNAVVLWLLSRTRRSTVRTWTRGQAPA